MSRTTEPPRTKQPSTITLDLTRPHVQQSLFSFRPDLVARLKEMTENEPTWLAALRDLVDGNDAIMESLVDGEWKAFNAAMAQHGRRLSCKQGAKIELAVSAVASVSEAAGFLLGVLAASPGAIAWAQLLQQPGDQPQESRNVSTKKASKGGRK